MKSPLTPEDIADLIALARRRPDLREKLLQMRGPGRPKLAVNWRRAQKLRDAGWSYLRIAQKLGISEGSVYGHLKH